MGSLGADLCFPLIPEPEFPILLSVKFVAPYRSGLSAGSTQKGMLDPTTGFDSVLFCHFRFFLLSPNRPSLKDNGLS